MTAKHTPGPWVVAGKATINSACRGWVASMSTLDRAANARLVASAPDLLAALKHCVIERSEWLEEARAAISKAEGEHQ